MTSYNFVNRVNEYTKKNNITNEELAHIIEVHPVKFKCFLYGNGSIAGSALKILDMLINLEEKEEEDADVK